MRINTNISALNAQNQNTITNNNLNNSLEKLSSGLRINKAADDASGMAIADKLRTQASTVGQGIANANSGNALITIADKAMSEQSKILDSVKTKLLQAATSTTSYEGREAIRKDISKLLEQIDNISEQTTYNGINLLNEKNSVFEFQVGEKATDIIGMTTAYAINTTGLGAGDIALNEEGSLLNFADTNVVGIKDVGGQMTLQYNDGESPAASTSKGIQIGQTAAGVGTIDGAISFSIEAEDVTGLTFNGNAGVVLETTDAALISELSDFAGAGGNITKVNDTTFILGATDGVKFAAAIDITDLKVSNFTTGATLDNQLTIVTDSQVSVTKDAGAAYLGFASVDVTTTGIIAGTAGALTQTLTGLSTSTGDAVSYNITGTAANAGVGIIVEEGTLGVQVETEKVSSASGLVDIAASGFYVASAQAAVVIENAYSGAAASNGGEAVFTLNANEVSELVFTNSDTNLSAGPISLSLSTSNAETQNLLDEIAANSSKLTKIGTGAYSYDVVTTGDQQYSSLDFGDADIKDLTIAGMELGEDLAVVTEKEVFITSSGDTRSDLSDSVRVYAGAVDPSTKTIDAGGQLNGASGDILKTSESLAGLATLEEGGLTAEVANKFMDIVDNALTQLNSVRSDFGSTQGQLNVAINNMMTTQVNLLAAESVIRDVDYAAESANFNKQNIISQAGTYALSQANQVQQNVLRLLQ